VGGAARLRALAERWTGWTPADRHRALAGLLVVAGAVVATVVGSFVFPFHSVNHDEGVYLAQAAMLMEGQLFLDPPAAELFRPWFFVERPDGRLYPKYAPVPAATFALGWLVGSPRVGLVGVTAGVVLLTYALAATLFDRRLGLLAATLLFVSPLFLLHSGVFLPYAPTAVWNLLFAFAYVRADRDRSRRWAAVAGVAVGIAFFARPYTAVAFAAPFVCHAVWTLRGRVRAAAHDTTLLGLHRPTLTRQSLTAVGGLGGVAAALAYNAVVTGDPLVFPYEAFAPRDGIGFGEREILGYERTYTPALGIRANAEVVWRLATRWVPAGAVGTVLAFLGVTRLRQTAPSRTRTHRLLLAATVGSVVVANVAFWGNLNVLGDLALPADGLIASLGPYYHYDLIVPTAVFAAVGLRRLHARLAGDASRRSTRNAVVAAGLAVLVVAAAVAVTAPPVERNTDATQTYRSAYAPFTDAAANVSVTAANANDAGGVDANDTAANAHTPGDWASDTRTTSTDAPPPFDRVGRPALTTPADAVVLLPRPFGDWLAHPYQPLRNDPDFDASTLYALDGRPFAVVDSVPDRQLYRYVSRGEWAPSRGSRVAARLQPVTRETGDGVRLAATLGVPRSPDAVSVRLAAGDDQSYYAARVDGDRLNLTLTVDGETVTAAETDDEAATVRLAGAVDPVGDGANLTVTGRETVTLTVFLDYGSAGGTGYRLRLPVAAGADQVRAVTPRLSVCRRPAECGDEAGYVPRDTPEGVVIDTTLSATNGSTDATSLPTAPSRPRHPTPSRATDSHDGGSFSSVAAPTRGVQSHTARDRVLRRDD